MEVVTPTYLNGHVLVRRRSYLPAPISSQMQPPSFTAQNALAVNSWPYHRSMLPSINYRGLASSSLFVAERGTCLNSSLLPRLSKMPYTSRQLGMIRTVRRHTLTNTNVRARTDQLLFNHHHCPSLDTSSPLPYYSSLCGRYSHSQPH